MAFQVFSYIVLLFCLNSHIVQAHLYESNNNISNSIEFLNRLSVGVKKGDHVKNVYELKKYLSHLGYLTYNNNQSRGHENIFDDSLEIALRRYQEFYDLNISGFLDADTIAKMRKPRCDMSDLFTFNNKGLQNDKTSYYSFFPGDLKWSKKNLSYMFGSNVPKKARQALELALKEWASVTPFMFYKVTSTKQADILFCFMSGDHGDGHPFGDDSLAHVFPPPDGRIHFDKRRRWSWAHKILWYDMKSVGLHELGHVLGLFHTKVRNAIMYPTIPKMQKKKIHKDDIDGINTLYN